MRGAGRHGLEPLAALNARRQRLSRCLGVFAGRAGPAAETGNIVGTARLSRDRVRQPRAQEVHAASRPPRRDSPLDHRANRLALESLSPNRLKTPRRRTRRLAHRRNRLPTRSPRGPSPTARSSHPSMSATSGKLRASKIRSHGEVSFPAQVSRPGISSNPSRPGRGTTRQSVVFLIERSGHMAAGRSTAPRRHIGLGGAAVHPIRTVGVVNRPVTRMSSR